MNKLNKHIIFLFVLVGFALTGSAQAFRAGGSGNVVRQPQRVQRKPNVNPEIFKIKKDFIAQHLELSEDQKGRFLAKFEEYQEDYNSITALLEESKGDFVKEKTYKQQLIGIQTHYYEEFVKMMPAAKASKVFQLERQFNLEVLRRLKESQKQR